MSRDKTEGSFDRDRAREAARVRWRKAKEAQAKADLSDGPADVDALEDLVNLEIKRQVEAGLVKPGALVQIRAGFARLKEQERERVERESLPELSAVAVVKSAREQLPFWRYLEVRRDMIADYERTLAELRAMPTEEPAGVGDDASGV